MSEPPDLIVRLAAPSSPPEAAAGHVAVIIDLFRASTTICSALHAGAGEVRPVPDLESAREWKARLPEALLGGERGGLPPPGFDLGNSPAEYTPARIAGRTVIFTTTNGTAALRAARSAHRVAFGCLANAGAVSAWAVGERAGGRPVSLLCAGLHGQPSLEDAVAAGALAERMLALPGGPRNPDDMARLCLSAWRGAGGGPGVRLAEVLRGAEGGRNVIAIGLARDLDTCLDVDSLPVVPVAAGDPWVVGADHSATDATSRA